MGDFNEKTYPDLKTYPYNDKEYCNLYSDKIMVFFDCGNGDGFFFCAPFGYKH